MCVCARVRACVYVCVRARVRQRILYYDYVIIIFEECVHFCVLTLVGKMTAILLLLYIQETIYLE